MRVVQLDPRLSLHPKMFGLSAGAWKEYIEGWFYLAEHPEVDFIPSRFTTPRYARELTSVSLWYQDGAVFRTISDTDSIPNQPVLPLVEEVLGSKTLVLAPKPESSKALVLEGKSVEDFARFWDAFGLKMGRKLAFVAWKGAIKKADPDVIIEAAARTKAWIDGHPNPPTRMYAQGWLNQEKWTDVLPPYPNPNGRRIGPGGQAIREAAEMEARGE